MEKHSNAPSQSKGGTCQNAIEVAGSQFILKIHSVLFGVEEKSLSNRRKGST
jgi:hypothetical protein